MPSRRWFGLWRATTGGLVLAGVGVLGCTLMTGPSLGGTYSLVRIDGNPLPAVIDAFRGSYGNRYELQLLSGTMKFRSGVFQEKLAARRVTNGIPGDSILAGGYSGVYRWRDSRTMVLQWVGDLGYRESMIYEVFEDGRVLRGVTNYYRLKEWVRE